MHFLIYLSGLLPCYFVDVLGFMIGISAMREYLRDGKMTKMVIFEITDDR